MEDTQKFKKKLEGVVVSSKNDKTIVVKVNRRFKHSEILKFVNKTKNIMLTMKIINKAGDKLHY